MEMQIRNRSDHKKAMGRLEIIFDAKKGSPKGNELEVLGIAIERYEKEHFPIGRTNPIEALAFRVEQINTISDNA